MLFGRGCAPDPYYLVCLREVESSLHALHDCAWVLEACEQLVAAHELNAFRGCSSIRHWVDFLVQDDDVE